MRKQQGQGALEYLLLIGGGVLVAVVVIALIFGVAGANEESIDEGTGTAFNRVQDAREDLTSGSNHRVRFEASTENSTGTCDETISVYATVDGNPYGNTAELPFGDATRTEYTITIPGDAVVGELVFMLNFSDSTLCAGADKNIKVYSVSVSNADDSGPWEKNTGAWESWENNGVDSANCPYSSCVRSAVNFG